jgi:hypothetical protein
MQIVGPAKLASPNKEIVHRRKSLDIEGSRKGRAQNSNCADTGL